MPVPPPVPVPGVAAASVATVPAMKSARRPATVIGIPEADMPAGRLPGPSIASPFRAVLSNRALKPGSAESRFIPALIASGLPGAVKG